jgi:rubrerythrin
MNIFEYARKMEKEKEKFYKGLAEKSPNKGLSNILNMLSVEEAGHYKVVEAMEKGIFSVPETEGLLSRAKDVFARLDKEKDDFKFSSSQAEVYIKALGYEEKSRDFYMTKGREEKDENIKKILLALAEEEKKHYRLIENIVEFISRPASWLENAEFNHLEEY